MFRQAAKVLMVSGIALFIIGAFCFLASKLPWIGRLPGDILIEKGDFRFYFPLTTCLLLSAAASLIYHFILKR